MSTVNGRGGRAAWNETTGESTSEGDRVSAKSLLRIIERQQFRCALTGWPLDPSTASLDHIVPIAEGGEHALHNLHVVHREVNRAKGAMTMDEFVAMCRAVVKNAT